MDIQSSETAILLLDEWLWGVISSSLFITFLGSNKLWRFLEDQDEPTTRK